MKVKVIYENDDVLVVDKPAGIVVFPPASAKASAGKEEKTLIDLLLEKHPALKNVGEKPRYGIVHRLDKDTSGILLTAKNNKSLIFLQKQFSSFARHLASYGGSTKAFGEGRKDKTLEKRLKKRYIALVVGKVKNNQGVIETLIGRALKDRKKQKVYLPAEPGSEGKREAVTGYKVMERFTQLNNFAKGEIAAKQHLTGLRDYTLLEISPKTGRKHQIRCHFSYLGHPIAGDKVYSFKNQPCPKGLNRQFLHASYLKIKLPDGKKKEFKSKLPKDLEICLQKLKLSTKLN